MKRWTGSKMAVRKWPVRHTAARLTARRAATGKTWKRNVRIMRRIFDQNVIRMSCSVLTVIGKCNMLGRKVTAECHAKLIGPCTSWAKSPTMALAVKIGHQ